MRPPRRRLQGDAAQAMPARELSARGAGAFRVRPFLPGASHVFCSGDSSPRGVSPRNSSDGRAASSGAGEGARLHRHDHGHGVRAEPPPNARARRHGIGRRLLHPGVHPLRGDARRTAFSRAPRGGSINWMTRRSRRRSRENGSESSAGARAIRFSSKPWRAFAERKRSRRSANRQARSSQESITCWSNPSGRASHEAPRWFPGTFP